MNVFEKSEVIKSGLRKGFQGGNSKMAKRRCYGYKTAPDGTLPIVPEEAEVVTWIFEQYKSEKSLGKIATGLEQQVSSLQQERLSGIGRRSTSCSPMKNIQAVCFSRKPSASVLSKLKTMASWIGISIPTPMRPLFLMNCLRRYDKKSSDARGIPNQDFP